MSDAKPVVHVVDDDASFLVARRASAAGGRPHAFGRSHRPSELLAELGRYRGLRHRRSADARHGRPGSAASAAARRELACRDLSLGRGGHTDHCAGDAPGRRRLPHEARAEGGAFRGGGSCPCPRCVSTRGACSRASVEGTDRDPHGRASTEVLRQVVEGRLNKQIAADLGINERTVKLHRTAITTKLQVRSVAELTRLVQDAGWFNERSPTFPKGQ